MLQLVENPQLQAGKEALKNIEDTDFRGYIRTSIEALFFGADHGIYTFEELGTTEQKAIDDCCQHINTELARNSSSTFSAYHRLKAELEMRRARKSGAQKLPHYADNIAFVAKLEDAQIAA